MKTALVIGGGIAGPVAAMALQQAGIQAHVAEARSADASELGSWLTLQPNGMDALRAIAVDDLIADIGIPTGSMRFTNGAGKVLGTLPAGAPRRDGATSRTVARLDLHRVLRNEAVRRGVSIRFERRMVAATTGPSGVQATFSDGQTVTADLLIGADGIRSTVRDMIDPNAPTARYVPVLNLGAHVPGVDTGAPPGQWQMMFGTRCFFAWMATPDGGTVWFANPPRNVEPRKGELAGITDHAWRAHLHTLLDRDTSPAPELIDATPEPLVGWATYDVPKVPHWHRGDLAIIGDAAHAVAPSSGQGASLALEDAVLVAKCLRDLPDATTAFAAFEQLRRRRVEKIVKLGRRSSSSKAAGPVARRIRDVVLPMIFNRAAKDGGESQRWITDHHIDWRSTIGPLPARLHADGRSRAS